jgi:predicted ribosomally synthesized peptide with SipW-like signal peptide
MTDKFELSRRKALLGLGTVGLAGAGAGVGTSALFTDEESFNNNTMVAGELNLLVDYWTSQNTNTSSTDSGTQDGAVSALLELTDVKPGDDGKVVFCPKIIDNPAYLWAGSSGLTQYENGYTEPEGGAEDMNATDDSIEGRGLNGTAPEDEFPVADVDDGSSPDSPSGEGFGELADNVQVTVSYCEPSDDLDDGEEPSSPDDFQTVRELNNPEDYTLADLILELQTGFPISNNADGTYPASADENTQAGPCLCIDWEVPIDVGNEIQSDSVMFDIGFGAVQSRNVSDPAAENPYADAVAAADYFNPAGHGNPTDGSLVASVNFGSDMVTLSFNFQDDGDGVDFADTSDYSATNLPVMIDADENGFTDYQLVWNPNGSLSVASAPFAKREHDNSDGSPGAYVEVPSDWSVVKSGDMITWGIPASELGSSFKLSTWGSTGGEGPVVEISTDSDNSPNFTDSTNYVQVSDS